MSTKFSNTIVKSVEGFSEAFVIDVAAGLALRGLAKIAPRAIPVVGPAVSIAMGGLYTYKIGKPIVMAVLNRNKEEIVNAPIGDEAVSVN